MTNEEKAKELAEKNSCYYNVYQKCGGETVDEFSYDECYQTVLEMAEWKDDYYKKLLDLLIKSGADPNITTNYIKNCIEL